MKVRQEFDNGKDTLEPSLIIASYYSVYKSTICKQITTGIS